MDWKVIFDSMVPTLGQSAVNALATELRGLKADASEPWKQSVLALTVDAVEKFGPAGVQHATDVVHSILGGTPPQMDWADLEVASNILAHLQNAEADHKSSVKEFMARVGKFVGVLMSGFIKGIL